MITTMDEDRLAELSRAYAIPEGVRPYFESVLYQMLSRGFPRSLAYPELHEFAKVVGRHGEKGRDAAAILDKYYSKILGKARNPEHRNFFFELNKKELLPENMQRGYDLLTLAHEVQEVVTELSIYNASARSNGEKIPTERASILHDASRRFSYSPSEFVGFASFSVRKAYCQILVNKHPDRPTEEELQRLAKMFDAANLSSPKDIDVMKLFARIAYRYAEPAAALRVLQKAVISYYALLEDPETDIKVGSFIRLEHVDQAAPDHSIGGLEARIKSILLHR